MGKAPHRRLVAIARDCDGQTVDAIAFLDGCCLLVQGKVGLASCPNFFNALG